MAIHPPQQGLIFWPVGTGDSTTIRVADTLYFQLDLRHMAKSEDDEDPAWPVIDELIAILPTLNQTPYLSVFALTQPDQDHCQGFEELNDHVIISELWMSPPGSKRRFGASSSTCPSDRLLPPTNLTRGRQLLAFGCSPNAGQCPPERLAGP